MSVPPPPSVNPGPSRTRLQSGPSSFATSLFDHQVNGFAGVDFQTAGLTLADLRKGGGALRACQTHRILLTFITDGVDELEAKFKRVQELRAQDPMIAETVCGYHLEG